MVRELRGTFDRRLPEAVSDALIVAAADPTLVHRRLADLHVWTLTPLDPEYPLELHELADKPAVLYGQGRRELLEEPRRVAVVGTRKPTLAGRAFAAAVARRLVDCRAVVVSGLAMGIDGAAHAATVEAGGATIAVIGSGHAEPGPRVHARLAASILASGGAIISELAPDSHATPGTFPKRNRIISILCQATIVIDAPTGSGALITARHALEQGRLVLVAPGRPTDPAVTGSLALLRETPARPLVGLDELVVDLGYDTAIGAAQRAPTGRPASLGVEAALQMLGPAERLVARRLLRGPASADALVADTGLAPAVASGALTLLLLRGWAQQLGPAYLGAGPLGVR